MKNQGTLERLSLLSLRLDHFAFLWPAFHSVGCVSTFIQFLLKEKEIRWASSSSRLPLHQGRGA